MAIPYLIHGFAPSPAIERCDYAVMPSQLPKEALDGIEGFGDVLLRVAGQEGLVGAGPVNERYAAMRESHIAWIQHQPETEWLYTALGEMVRVLNAKHWRFDISGFYERLQYTTYADHGHFGWHMDMTVSSHPTRKLAIVLLLSEPGSDFEGGAFQINNGSPQTVALRRGDVIVFPGWLLHQVTPLEWGKRKSIVGWIGGDPFK